MVKKELNAIYKPHNFIFKFNGGNLELINKGNLKLEIKVLHKPKNSQSDKIPKF